MINKTNECLGGEVIPQRKQVINRRARNSLGSLRAIHSFYPQTGRVLPPSCFPFISHSAQDPPGEMWRPKKEDEDRIGTAASRTRLKCRSVPAPVDAPVCATFGASSGRGWVGGSLDPPRFPRLFLFSRCTPSVDDHNYHFHVLSNTPPLVVAPLRRPPLLCYPKERSGRAALPCWGHAGVVPTTVSKKSSNWSAANPSTPIPKTHQQLGCPSPPLPCLPANGCTVFCHRRCSRFSKQII